MANLFTAAQLTKFRKVWINDLVDDHTEIGGGASTSASAAQGATSLALSGLGSASGTVSKGTGLLVHSAGYVRLYQAAADATISGSAATVTITPALWVAAASGDRVLPRADLAGAFNRKTRRQLFLDSDIQDFATRAQQWRAREIAESPDPEEALFKATAVKVAESLLENTGWRDSLFAGEGADAARLALADIKELTAKFEREISPREFGPHTLSWVR